MNNNQREFVRALISLGGLVAAHHVRRIPPRRRFGHGLAIALVGFAVSEGTLRSGGGATFLQVMLEELFV